MVSYLARRRQWYQKLQLLDPNMNVSEPILADYLLTCSGLDNTQQLMIKTAIGSDEKTFATVACFLRKHHSAIHENETSDKVRGAVPPPPRPEKSWKPRAKHTSKNRKPSFNGRRPKPRAFNAKLDDNYEKDDSSESDEDDDETAYLCHCCAPTSEFEDFEDAIEQDVVVAFLAADCDLNDKEICEDIADSVHNEFVALAAREQAMKRGVPMQRVVHQYRPPQSDLTPKQRRAKVELAKQNSTCRKCGKSGHWAADECCPMNKKSTPQPAQKQPQQDHGRKPVRRKFRAAHLTLLDDSSSDEEEELSAAPPAVHAAVPATGDEKASRITAAPPSQETHFGLRRLIIPHSFTASYRYSQGDHLRRLGLGRRSGREYAQDDPFSRPG